MEPPEQRMRCIAATAEGRCPSFAKSKYFCDDHLERCNKLHDRYKRTCSLAQEKGRVVYRDIQTMNLDQLKEYVELLNKNDTLNKRCIDERSLFKEDCVQEECEDIGHRYFYSQFPSARKEIETLLLAANTRILKLERTSTALTKKERPEREFKPQSKSKSRSPPSQTRKKSASRSPLADIGELETEEFEELKLANLQEKQRIYSQKLNVIDQILGLITAIEHPNYENLSYDMNIELEFNLLLTFQQNLINSKLVPIADDEFFDKLLNFSRNNPPVVSAQTIAPFYDKFPLSVFESLFNLMKKKPWWLTRTSILGSYAAMPEKKDYDIGTQSFFKDKAKDQSNEKKKLAKRLALLLKLSKLDLKDRLSKLRGLILKIDNGLDFIAHRSKAYVLSFMSMDQLSKEEREKYKHIRGKVVIQNDAAFDKLEIFFFDYLNIPELEFLIEEVKKF